MANFCHKLLMKFQPIIDIAIDSFTLEDWYFLRITAVPLSVYNPDYIWNAHMHDVLLCVSARDFKTLKFRWNYMTKYGIVAKYQYIAMQNSTHYTPTRMKFERGGILEWDCPSVCPSVDTTPLPPSRVRFFSNCSQTWYGRTMGQDLGWVQSRETWLIKWALNELINYFHLLSPLPLSRVRFFSDRRQTW